MCLDLRFREPGDAASSLRADVADAEPVVGWSLGKQIYGANTHPIHNHRIFFD